MELKTFKKVINDLLIAKGFSKKGSYYYFYVQDLIIVIGLQKSNFSNGYYINIGYVINKLHPALEKPRDVDGDVRARFSLEKKGETVDFFDLDEILEDDQDKLQLHILENINQYVTSITSVDKLKFFLQENPVMLYQTTLTSKQFLGFV